MSLIKHSTIKVISADASDFLIQYCKIYLPSSRCYVYLETPYSSSKGLVTVEISDPYDDDNALQDMIVLDLEDIINECFQSGEWHNE